jgi:hypothetical protein
MNLSIISDSSQKKKKKSIDGELCMKTILKKQRTDEYQRKVEAFVELCSESLFQCLTV